VPPGYNFAIMRRLGGSGVLPLGVLLLVVGIVLQFDRVVTGISYLLIALGIVLGALGLINMMSGKGPRRFDDP
jgi:hypothetical protein